MSRSEAGTVQRCEVVRRRFERPNGARKPKPVLAFFRFSATEPRLRWLGLPVCLSLCITVPNYFSFPPGPFAFPSLLSSCFSGHYSSLILIIFSGRQAKKAKYLLA